MARKAGGTDSKPNSSAPRALYRRYRPTKLEDVVGEQSVTTALANAVKNGKIGHAYLFIGPRGTGKTSVARIFAHLVNGFDYQIEDSYLDIIEIDAASNTGVDNIRELREKAIIAPTKGRYKVYIIDEVHMLTKSAANALLKTLEEPPAHVIFIMATTDAHKVPITISSRTQVFEFQLADEEAMLRHLESIAKKENIDITPDALKIIVKKGGGSFRDSLSLLDQVATLSSEQITAPLLEEMLGLPNDQKITTLLENYQQKDLKKVSEGLKSLLNTGITPEVVASEILEKIISHPDFSLLPLLEKLPAVVAPFAEAKLLLALMSFSPAEAPDLNAKTGNLGPKTANSGQNNPISDPNSPENQPNSTHNTSLSPQNAPEAPSENLEPSDSANGINRPLSGVERLKAKMAAKAKEKATLKSGQNSPRGPETTLDDDSHNKPATMAAPTLNHFSVENFSWEALLESIKLENETVFHNLSNADYEFKDQTLHIYPLNNFAKTLLSNPDNFAVVKKYLGNSEVIIHPAGSKISEDPQISQISAIMGNVQEVKEADKEMPF